MRQKKVAAIFFTMIFALLLLASISTGTVSTLGDAANSLEISVSTSPKRIKEGDNTTISIEISQATPEKSYTLGINVTNPDETFSAINITIGTDATGSGSISTEYWRAFPGANTNYTGTYFVKVKNVTTNEILATTSFTVEVWLCQFQARNLANEPVVNLTIKVYNDTGVPAQFLYLTNENGTASIMLATGNYTFRAFWKQIEVGSYSVNVKDDIEEMLRVQLSNLKITVADEATNEYLPFIHLRLEYNNIVETTETNLTGTALMRNLFTNVNYSVGVERYGLPLPSSQVKVSPYPQPNELTVEFPTYTMFVRAEDFKRNPAEGVRVEAFEWSGGLTQDRTTGSNGNVTFSLTFGRYRVRVYNGTVLLNETIVDLTQNRSYFPIYLSNYNINFTVAVVDFFRQPIPNTMVKIERNTGTKYEVTAPSGFTGPDGNVTFSGIVGGDSRISIYVGGQLSGTKDLYLTNSEQVTFNLNRYVVVAGSALETSQFVTAIAIAILAILFIASLTYKRLLKIFVKSK